MVLSAASDYFSAMFTNEFGESFRNEIELQGVEPSALEALVGYCYTGTDYIANLWALSYVKMGNPCLRVFFKPFQCCLTW